MGKGSRFKFQGSSTKVQGLSFKVQVSRVMEDYWKRVGPFRELKGRAGHSGLRVQGSRFKFQGLSFKIQGLRVMVQGSRFRVQGSRRHSLEGGFERIVSNDSGYGGLPKARGSLQGIKGCGQAVQGSRFKVQGSRFKVQGSRFKGQGGVVSGVLDYGSRGRLLLMLLIFSLAMISVGCSKDEGHDHAMEISSVKYTCPMHPDVTSDTPGRCPVCGMDLVKAGATPKGHENDLMLTDSQIRLANITVEKVSPRVIGQTVLVNGRLVADEELSKTISSRTRGRIEKLYVKETGRVIQKGEPLYQLYSETLLTLQREFLLAKDQYDQLGNSGERYKSFLEAARRKLVLYGLTESQIDKLETDKIVQTAITFVAPVSGIVTRISVVDGQYIDEGTALMEIDNTTSLWVEAELYPAERELVKIGDRINVRVSGFGQSPVEAQVTFLAPEYRANSQITIMRASLSNRDMKFTPGMHAQIVFSHSSKTALALPVDALIRDGDGTHAYVQRGRNTFRPVRIETGIENFDQVEITHGLTEADTVAVSGAYLLYSEMILKNGRHAIGDK